MQCLSLRKQEKKFKAGIQMYKKSIAAAAAILVLVSSVEPSMAAPVNLTETKGEEMEIAEEAQEILESETQTEIETETDTEEETESEPQAGFVEEAGFIPETETETEEMSSQEEEEEVIQSPVVEDTFRLFQVEKEYALAKKDKSPIYEEMNMESDKVGEIEAQGVLHILSEEKNEWYYVESGNVRGFMKENYLLTGKKARIYVEAKEESKLATAKKLKEPFENKAFLYKQTTAYDVVVEKKYALAKWNTNILDEIPQEAKQQENISEDTSRETFSLEDKNAEVLKNEQKSIEKSDNSDLNSTEKEIFETEAKEKKEKKPTVVGTLKKDGLCFILNKVDEKWFYVESGDVRGFVKADNLERGKKVRREIKDKGEEAYDLAQENVRPQDNKACYYTITSVKEASVSGLIRTSMIKFAEQFLGNPYVWGGTSLTKGADCSGFVQSIYANFGYSIPRVAEDQAYCAQKIPVEDALPGDLIFYRKNDYIYHVVMSTGNGGTIEAKGSATGIVRSTVNYDNAVWAVRIISDKDTEILDYIREKNIASEYYNEAVIAKSTDYGKFLGNFKLTAYCSCPVCCGIWSGGPTASGLMPIENHTVAMAGVPFGTNLIINGKLYTVEDRGTPYGHVDIYMNNHWDALQFGVQYADVFEKN